MLFEEFFVPLQKIEKVTEPDGEGGHVTRWVDGEEFEGAVVMDKSGVYFPGSSADTERTYTVTVPVGTGLEFYQPFKRLSDGMVFRVTSSPNDIKTPYMASFQFEQVKAEAWRLPDE